MDQTPQYPKGDLRRMLAVLAAIDTLESATLVRLADRTGIDKKTVTNLIEQARAQAGVVVAKTGPVYTITEWGPVIKKTGARMCLTGALNAPII
jgi:hypothetical protein